MNVFPGNGIFFAAVAGCVLFASAVDGKTGNDVQVLPELELAAGTTEALIAPRASSATRFAASELTNILSRVFGEPVPLVTTPTAGKKQIVVGVNLWSKEEGIDPEKTGKEDGFVIKATANRLYLCGVDGTYQWYEEIFRKGRGVGLLQGRRSSSFAVYEFLERYCDCRFYWPGELGEITPRARTVKVPLGETAYAPKLIIRKYYHPQYENPPPWKDNGWIEDNEYSEGQGMCYSWSRLRMGSFDIPCCHGINGFEFLRRFGKDHPEYFALKKDGTRFTRYEGYGASKYGMVCLSSGVMEELYQDVKSYLTGESPDVRKIHKGWGGKWDWSHSFRNRKYVDIMPNDSQYKCCCEKCKAKYNETDPSGLYASELVWGYTRDIANRLIKEGVPGYVTQMAYEHYSRIPAFDIPTNVMVMVAKTGPFSIRKPEMLARDNAEIRKWKNKVGNVWIWTYPNKYGKLKVVGVPTMTPRAWGNYYKMVAPDIFGAFAESECDRFFFNHLNYYVFSKVCWDPSVDVDALLHEYFTRCYGAAAPEAEQFCRELEDKFLDEMVGAYEMTGAGPQAKAPSVHEIWTSIYSPSVLGKWSRLLDAGAAKLAKGSLEARRFKVFRDELLGVMSRTSDDHFSRTDAKRQAAIYKANPPKRNLIRRDVGWYSFKEDDSVKIVSDRSLKIVSTNGTAVSLYYLDGGSAYTLKPNTRYRISFFVKGENIVPVRQGGGAGITICDAFNNSYPKPAALSGTFDWLYQSFEHKTAAETNLRGRSYIYLRVSGANGTAWFDGITIEEIPDQLAEPGKCAVVVDPKASKVTRFAAKELSRFLTRRFSGKEVPVKTAIKDGEFAFIVGDNAWSRAAGLDPTKLPRDGFAVKTAPGRVFICGTDDPREDIEGRMRKGWGTRCEMASLFGVYDFLEKVADCRFFFPGELGEIVRKGDDLPIQNLDYTSAPDYTARRIYDGSRCAYFDGDGKEEKVLNQYRTRMETANIPCCHGLRSHDYIRRFGKTHPEYFALQQGKRNTDPNYRHPHQFCFSSQGFKDEVYKDIVKAFKGGAKYFDAMPQDEMVPCECPQCRAAYAAGPKEEPATDLVWGMVRDWGNRLIADGIPGELTLLAYSPYRAVPTFALPTNIQVMVAVYGPFALENPALLKKTDALIKAWTDKVGHKVWIWTYPDKYGGLDIKGIPNFAMNAWGRYYPERRERIFGSFAESETDRWFFNHINYYIYGKTSWNNALDCKRLMDDYKGRMFGPTVVQWYMSRFIESLEEKWTKKVAGRVVETTLGPKGVPPSDKELWEDIYSPKVLAGYDKTLQGARTAAEKQDDPLVARRIDLYRRELYEPLVAASKEYFDRKKAVESLPVLKPDTDIPLIPFDTDKNQVFGRIPDNLSERDIQAVARIGKDDKFLRVCFDMAEPRMDDALAVKRPHDDRMLWMDNSVEFHFCPTGDRNLTYQILVNSLGCHTDLRKTKIGQSTDIDWNWNPDLQVKTARTAKGWRCEISIPLDSVEPLAKRVPVEMARSRMLKREDKYHRLFHTSPLVTRFGRSTEFSVVEF